MPGACYISVSQGGRWIACLELSVGKGGGGCRKETEGMGCILSKTAAKAGTDGRDKGHAGLRNVSRASASSLLQGNPAHGGRRSISRTQKLDGNGDGDDDDFQSTGNLEKLKSDALNASKNNSDEDISQSEVSSRTESDPESESRHKRRSRFLSTSIVKNQARQRHDSSNSRSKHGKKSKPHVHHANEENDTFDSFSTVRGDDEVRTSPSNSDNFWGKGRKSSIFSVKGNGDFRFPRNSPHVSQDDEDDDCCARIMARKMPTTTRSQTFKLRKEWIDGEQRDTSYQEEAGSDKNLKIAQVLDNLNAQDGLLSRDQVRAVLNRVMGGVDALLFDKIFALFDVNGSEQVDRKDFVVALAFLSQQGSARNAVDLAFRLFDTDANGGLSRSEFNTMITAIMSNRLKHALDTPYGREAFRTHMETEWSLESIQFWEIVTKLCTLYGKDHEEGHIQDKKDKEAEEDGPAESTVPSTRYSDACKRKNLVCLDGRCCGIPVSMAKHVFDQYISENAPDQINIAGITQQEIKDHLKRATEKGEPTVPVQVFRQAAEEIMQLMEMDNFERFRRRLQKETERIRHGEVPNIDYAETAWTKLGLEHDALMTPVQFRVWAKENPSYFYFLEDIRKALHPFFAKPCSLMEHCENDIGTGEIQSGIVAQDYEDLHDDAPRLGSSASSVKEPLSEGYPLVEARTRRLSEQTLCTDRTETASQASEALGNSESNSLQEMPALESQTSERSNASSRRSSVQMPKRLYQRYGTSLVSVRTGYDSDGRQVRVFTIDSSGAFQSNGSLRDLISSSRQSGMMPPSVAPSSSNLGLVDEKSIEMSTSETTLSLEEADSLTTHAVHTLSAPGSLMCPTESSNSDREHSSENCKTHKHWGYASTPHFHFGFHHQNHQQEQQDQSKTSNQKPSSKQQGSMVNGSNSQGRHNYAFFSLGHRKKKKQSVDDAASPTSNHLEFFL